MRHGRKSISLRLDGYKAAVALDQESQLITAGAVLSGNAPDAQDALELVAQNERNAGLPVTATIGDALYGDGRTGQQSVGTVPPYAWHRLQDWERNRPSPVRKWLSVDPVP